MNLVLNNVRGSITYANSYYRDPYNCFGKFNYVMANPPFNVDDVELDQVKLQPRFNTYGVPQNKTKKSKGDAKETVPNGNYLWINLFATSLNEKGRAALVMANSASDAGHSEKDIRIKLIESGVISQMVTLPTNMFTSVTLPATLWFFDRAKPKKDEILFIDARNIFTQIDRAHRKFSDEQIKNLAIITRLYEGKTDEFATLLNEYRAALANAPETSGDEDTPAKAYWQEQIDWLTTRFPDAKYVDVIGLCKAAKLQGEDGVIDQDYSLNPGRYVGVVIEDDGMTEEGFKAEMRSLNAELIALNAQAQTLERTITANLQALVGDNTIGNGNGN
jgi:type I restriction enzyme M protein